MTIRASEFSERVKKVQTAMRKQSYAALLVHLNPDVRYLSNYAPFDSMDALVVMKSDGEPTLLIEQDWDLERAMHTSTIPDTRATKDLGRDLSETLARDGFQGKLGIVGWSRLPAPIYLSLTKRIPESQLDDASTLLQKIRMVKSSSEIELLERAARITDAGARAAFAAIRKGKSEFKIATAAENMMREEGAGGLSFTTVVGSGPRTNQIVPLPTTRKPKKGEFVLMDLGALYEGYHGDTSRTKHVGSISSDQRDLFEAVTQIHAEATKAVKPGTLAYEIHEIAKRVATEAGYGDLWKAAYLDLPTNLTGHGLGLEEHERPHICTHMQTERKELEPGMVITIEPGLYAKGVGGVRIEDMVLVTDSGHKVLTHSDRDF